MASPEAQRQMQALVEALQRDPNSQYGEVLPYAVTPEQQQNRGSTGPGAHPYAQRTGSTDARLALPGFIRDSLLGVTDMMRGAAGEVPAGEELPPRATMALMDVPAAGSLRGAGAFDPSMLAANWGGKNHAKRLQQLYHGTRNQGGAQGLREQGQYTRGRSAELGIPGTSLSYDPGVSAGQFGGNSPDTFFLNRHDIDPQEVYNLRPSDYLAKDFSGALPGKADPNAPKQAPANAMAPPSQNLPPAAASTPLGGNPYEALQDYAENIAEFEGGKAAVDMLPHFMQNVKFQTLEKGGPYQATWPDGQTKQYGTVSDMIVDGIDHPDVYWSNVDSEQSVKSLAQMYSSQGDDVAAQVGDDMAPSVQDDALDDMFAQTADAVEDELDIPQPPGVKNQASLESQDVLGGALDNAGFVVVKDDGGSYVAYDVMDKEPISVGNTPMEPVSDLVGMNLISGTDMQKVQAMLDKQAPTTADPGGPEAGAQLIRKPQSYYQEGEYFAPQDTGGQGRIEPRAANEPTNYQPSGMRQQQRGKNLSEQYRRADNSLTGVRNAVSPQEALAKLAPMKSAEGGAARRDLARTAAQKLRQQMNAFGDSEEALVAKSFFPQQQGQLERLQRLAQDIEDARTLQDQLQGSAARGARRGPARTEFDDAVRQETRAIDRFYKALEESDLPVMENRKRWDVISGDVARLARMARAQHGAMLQMGPDGKVVADNLKQLITQAGMEGVPIRQFATRMVNDLQDRGPITEALRRNDVEAAMQALAKGAARDEFDMDNPEDIMR